MASVENIKTKDKFVVSTARNPYGVYETAVFNPANSPDDVLKAALSPLFVVNASTTKQAELNHINTAELFEQLNPEDLIRKYKIEGSIGAQLLMTREGEDFKGREK